MYSLFISLIVVVIMLVNVAFVTLIERKILGLSQYRKGPNKVSLIGLLQPIRDALKLFLKEIVLPIKGNSVIFMISPVMGITLALTLWSLIPWKESYLRLRISCILFLVILRFGIYPLIIIGWASNRKYAIVGALRGVAQTISYEIRLALILLHFIFLASACSLKGVRIFNLELIHVLLCPLIGFFWLVSCVAETNRTPFDFSEGESELVSGFNIEYGGAGFTLIFMAEYSIILFLSLIRFIFILIRNKSNIIIRFGMVSLAFFWVWIRSTFPRYRYDKLMRLAWKAILPLVIFILVWDLGILRA